MSNQDKIETPEINSDEIIGHKNIAVITTRMLAEYYEVDTQNIRQNFNNNKERFIEDKHYFKLSGKELKEFRKSVEKIDSLTGSTSSILYLWTEKGAARHTKMLNTDRAWDVFEMLEDSYFEIYASKADRIPSDKQMLLFPLRDMALQRDANHQRNKTVGKKSGKNGVIKMWTDVLHKELYPEGTIEEAVFRGNRDGLNKRTMMSYQDIFRKYPDLHGYAITSAFVNKMVEDKSLGVSIDEKTAIRWAKQMQATALEIGEHFCTNPAITPDGTQSELPLN